MAQGNVDPQTTESPPEKLHHLQHSSLTSEGSDFGRNVGLSVASISGTDAKLMSSEADLRGDVARPGRATWAKHRDTLGFFVLG